MTNKFVRLAKADYPYLHKQLQLKDCATCEDLRKTAWQFLSDLFKYGINELVNIHLNRGSKPKSKFFGQTTRDGLLNRHLKGEHCPNWKNWSELKKDLKAKIDALEPTDAPRAENARARLVLLTHLVETWRGVTKQPPEVVMDKELAQRYERFKCALLQTPKIDAQTPYARVTNTPQEAERSLSNDAGEILSEAVELSSETEVFVAPTTSALPTLKLDPEMHKLLRELGVAPMLPLDQPAFRQMFVLPVIGEAVVLAYMGGEEGLAHEKLVCEYKSEVLTPPPFVLEKVSQIPLQLTKDLEPLRGGLRKYSAEGSDIFGRCYATVGMTSYQMRMAARASVNELIAELSKAGSAREYLRNYPGLIYCDSVVVTKDDMLVLCWRDSHNDGDVNTWHVVGEGMDLTKDLVREDNSRLVQRTALRGIQEELNIRAPLDDILRICPIALLSLTFNLRKANHTFVWFAPLDLPSEPLLTQARTGQEGEHKEFMAVPFVLSRCARIVVTGLVDAPAGLPQGASDACRMDVFLAMERKFGRDAAAAALRACGGSI